MKKITAFLTMALMAMMTFTFTSCDEDSDIAYTLDGTWKGNMYVVVGERQAIYSVIEFDNDDGWYSGSGYWVDYFEDNYWGGHDYIANHIEWTVRNGNIYISLLDEGSEVVIYDYALDDGRFVGYVDASNGKRAKFEMYKDSYDYNWRDYEWGDGYWDDYVGYGKTLQPGTVTTRSADSMKVNVEKPVRKFVVK